MGPDGLNGVELGGLGGELEDREPVPGVGQLAHDPAASSAPTACGRCKSSMSMMVAPKAAARGFATTHEGIGGDRQFGVRRGDHTSGEVQVLGRAPQQVGRLRRLVLGEGGQAGGELVLVRLVLLTGVLGRALLIVSDRDHRRGES